MQHLVSVLSCTVGLRCPKKQEEEEEECDKEKQEEEEEEHAILSLNHPSLLTTLAFSLTCA